MGLLDRRLLFVTGKGGVGKSTVAAALGLLASRQGLRTLVCEVDAKGNLADFFEIDRVGFDARSVGDHLSVMSMQTEESLKEYLRLQLKVPLLAKIGPLARTFDFVANAAPGVKEILTVGKLCYEVRERNYDLVVVDAVASGHVIGQLAAPQAINEMVAVGLVRGQTSWMLDLLRDPAVTGAVVVAAPEEMPVNETIELVGRIRSETVVDVASVVVNRVLPELFSRADEEVFDLLRSPEGVAAVDAAVGGRSRPLFEAAELAVTLRRTRAEHLERLRAELPAGLPVLYLPELFTRAHGVRVTNQVAAALGDELGL